MDPQLRCTTCGYARRVDVRALVAKATTCPRCPDRPKLVLDRGTTMGGPGRNLSGAQEAS